MTFEAETCRFNLCFYYIVVLTEIDIIKWIYRINTQWDDFVQITQGVCNPFPNFYIWKLDNLVQNILTVVAQYIFTFLHILDQEAYQIWTLININSSGTVKFFITYEDLMANDCSEICRGPWTSQREMMRLTAQEYFPANFLTRHTNVSVSTAKHKYRYFTKTDIRFSNLLTSLQVITKQGVLSQERAERKKMR